MSSPTPSHILDELSIRMWEPELAERWRARSLPPAAMTVLLILAFETDVQMDGLLGFLENTTGEFLPDITRAFETIGASKTSQLLETVAGVMAKHGVTHAQLRGDLDGMPEYTITTFKDSHDERARRMADELRGLKKELYLSDSTSEPVHRLLETYAAKHGDELQALLAG